MFFQRSSLASLGIVLLCFYFVHHDRGRWTCHTSMMPADPGVVAAASFMGTKTPYSFLRRRQRRAAVDVSESAAGCQPIKMYAVIRHGARHTTAKRAAETNRLKTAILNSLGPQFTKNFPEYTSTHGFNSSTESHGDISALGMKEQYCLAVELKSMFPELLGKPYSKHYYNFRSSQSSRSFKSALSFAAGLFKDEGPLDGYQPIDVETTPTEEDNILRFDEHDCPLYDRQVSLNMTLAAELEKLLHSPSMKAVRDHVQAMLDPDGQVLKISTEDVFTLFKLCIDETAQSLRLSYWCELLSPVHLATLHRYNNVKAFWKKGGGVPTTALRSVHLIRNIVHFFSDESSPKVAFRFGHSETLVPMLAFLEVLSSSPMYFDTSIISPFSANAVFILYSCFHKPEPGMERQPQLFVSLLLNEIPAEMNLCPHEARELRPTMCPLAVLEREAALKTFGWKSMKQLCALPESEL